MHEHDMERIWSVKARKGMLGERSREVDEVVGEVIWVGGLAISFFGKQRLGDCDFGSVSMSALSNGAAHWCGSPASLIKRECIRYVLGERSAWSRSVAARCWEAVRGRVEVEGIPWWP